jgi:hypothetical protein
LVNVSASNYRGSAWLKKLVRLLLVRLWVRHACGMKRMLACPYKMISLSRRRSSDRRASCSVLESMFRGALLVAQALKAGALNVVRTFRFALNYFRWNAGHVPGARGTVGTGTIRVMLACTPAIQKNALVAWSEDAINAVRCMFTDVGHSSLPSLCCFLL